MTEKGEAYLKRALEFKQCGNLEAMQGMIEAYEAHEMAVLASQHPELWHIAASEDVAAVLGLVACNGCGEWVPADGAGCKRCDVKILPF